MRSGGATLALWGAFLAILAALSLGFTTSPYVYGLLGGAALAVVVLAGAFSLGSRDAGIRPVPDLSYATVALAVGGALAGLGAAFGTWLWAPGAGLALLALGGLVRERRAEGTSAR